MRVAAVALTALVFSAPASRGQSLYHLDPDQQRADRHYRLGWEAFRAEDWTHAAKEFQEAIDIKPRFTLAYYGLGRSYMGLKRFPDAIKAYENCRGLYEAVAAEKFHGAQEADLMRQQDIDAIRIAINTLNSRSGAGQVNQGTQNQVRQLRDAQQRIQLKRDAINNNISMTSEVPGFVSLALGSAYFRSERLADAERAYKNAIDVDPKSGETHNNLAVVYLLTGRADLAEKEVKLAETAGFAVNPNLKDDIRKKKAGS